MQLIRRCPLLVLLLLMVGMSSHGANVTVSGRQLLLDGRPFQVRGVCYAPTPIGQAGDSSPFGDYFTANYSAIYTRDLARMRQMGVNCVRVYGWSPTANHAGFLDAAYNGGSRPIYVLVNRWMNPNTNWNDTNAINSLVAEWVALSTNVMSHPVILGYLVGNELNWPEANRQNPAFWSALNRIFGSIRQHDTNHVVSTPLADAGALGSIGSFNSLMTNLNVWCLQTYRGGSFGTLFSDYARASTKPLIITEFGMDALDRRSGVEYVNNAELQANYVMSLWNQIALNKAVAAGGLVFEWNDEWWKSGSAWAQNEGGWTTAAFPDGWADEEWWGINRIFPNVNGGVNSLNPRALATKLTEAWTARMSVKLPSADGLQIEVHGGEGQIAVLQRASGIQVSDWVPVQTNIIPFSATLPGSKSPAFFRVELR